MGDIADIDIPAAEAVGAGIEARQGQKAFNQVRHLFAAGMDILEHFAVFLGAARLFEREFQRRHHGCQRRA